MFRVVAANYQFTMVSSLYCLNYREIYDFNDDAQTYDDGKSDENLQMYVKKSQFDSIFRIQIMQM